MVAGFSFAPVDQVTDGHAGALASLAERGSPKRGGKRSGGQAWIVDGEHRGTFDGRVDSLRHTRNGSPESQTHAEDPTGLPVDSGRKSGRKADPALLAGR